MKILIATDGSACSRRMLARLGAHDELLGPSHDYTVVHVVPPVSTRAAAIAGGDALHSYYEESAAETLEPVRAFLKQLGIAATITHCVGDPAAEIARLAEAGRFDLVVMGSHGHGSLARLALGSITTKVLARCSRPVLIIR